MCGKKKKEDMKEETHITLQANQLYRLEKKVDKLISENEFLRAELHRQNNEKEVLVKRFLNAMTNANESPFGASINSETIE